MAKLRAVTSGRSAGLLLWSCVTIDREVNLPVCNWALPETPQHYLKSVCACFFFFSVLVTGGVERSEEKCDS